MFSAGVVSARVGLVQQQLLLRVRVRVRGGVGWMRGWFGLIDEVEGRLGGDLMLSGGRVLALGE